MSLFKRSTAGLNLEFSCTPPQIVYITFRLIAYLNQTHNLELNLTPKIIYKKKEKFLLKDIF